MTEQEQRLRQNCLYPVPPLREGEELKVINGGLYRKNEQGTWYPWRTASELASRSLPSLTFF